MRATGTRRGGTLMAIGAIAFAIAAVLSPSAAVAAFPGENGRIACAAPRETLPGGGLNVDLFTVLPDGSGIQQLTDGPAIDHEPSWSADGRRLVFARISIGARHYQVFTINADGGELTRVAGTDSSLEPAPSFSPRAPDCLHDGGLDPHDPLRRSQAVPGADGARRLRQRACVLAERQTDRLRWRARRQRARRDLERAPGRIAAAPADRYRDGRSGDLQRLARLQPGQPTHRLPAIRISREPPGCT